MSANSNEKYIIRKPGEEIFPPIKNRQIPSMTMLSSNQIPGVNNYMEVAWIYGIPEPNPGHFEHTHKFDEMVLHVGGDPENPEDLGGEIDFYVAGNKLTLTKSCVMFIPAGMPHGPLVWNRFDRPHFEMAIIMGTGDAKEGMSGEISAPKEGFPEKRTDRDYSQYLPSKFIYEIGGGIKNRQSPTMTLMSTSLVPEANSYIDLGWIYGMPEPNPHVHEHTHKFDEFILFMGGDPQNPFDLGAEIEFTVDGNPCTFDKITSFWIPKGVKHGPLTWNKFQKPHMKMSIVFESGDSKKIWGDSGI